MTPQEKRDHDAAVAAARADIILQWRSEGQTQREIAETLGISQCRVQQIEWKRKRQIQFGSKWREGN